VLICTLARANDWLSWVYRAFSKIAFAYIGMDDETGRYEITDRLDSRGLCYRLGEVTARVVNR